MKSTVLYCFRYPESSTYKFRHFCARPIGDFERSVWGEQPDREAIKVDVREPRAGEESHYWAWWDAKSQAFPTAYVWPSFVQMDMCFAGGSGRMMELGHGEVVKVVIDVLGPGAA